MTALVGRDGELARLRELLAEAEAGHAVTGLVSGDAGVGKSRLVAEATSVATVAGFTVLCGQCAEIGDSVPYLPFADAFRTAPPYVEAAVKERPVLARLLPDGGGQPGETDWSGLARQQMFGAVVGLLTELSAERPVLLVLEDLHWADATTRHLVTILTRMLHRERVAIIGTYRTDDLYRRHPFRAVLAELLRLPSVTLVELGPLPAAALAEHLASLAAGTGGRLAGRPGQAVPWPLPALTLNRLVERAEGNAYYAEELLAVSSAPAATGPVSAGPATLGASDTLPTGLSELLLSRVERVSAAAQQVLRAAAVAGRRADDGLIRAASGLPDAEYEEAVREAVAHQLLVPDGPDGYRFRHALLREAVYGDLLPGERTRLHARLAALLTNVPGAAAELAHHCLTSHDIPGALAASVRAGAEAERIGAPAEAHRHYDQAIELWDRVEEAEELAGMSRGKLGMKSALAAAASGDVPRAVHLLRRIRAVLPPDADPGLRSRVGERLAYYLIQSENPEWFDEALSVAKQTVEQTPEDPPTWYGARALATYAIALMVEGDWDGSLAWARRARDVAGISDAPSVQADALATIGQLAVRDGDTGEAIGMFTAALEEAAAARALGVELRVACHLAQERLVRGELCEAARVAHEGVQRAETEGLDLAPFGMDLQHLHFQAHYADGEWDHAQELADGFPVRVARHPEAVLSAMALFIDVARGTPAANERRIWLEPFWDDLFVAYIARGLLAEHALWQGDIDGALAEAEAAIAADDQPHTPAVIRVAGVALSARADRAAELRARGDLGGAAAQAAAGERLLDLAREGARFPARPKAVLGTEGRGWVARCEAEYARLTGANSPEGWEKVLAEFGPGYVYETARTQWRLAEALVEAGRRDEAAEVWRAARDTASRLRAKPLAAALDGLARRARLDAGHGEEDSRGWQPGRLAGLTDRECEVLRLLARGMSNREIGAELFITPKTASVHVSNILAKLGAASRTEAAAIAHRELGALS
ncbi:MAG TPA: AAA family ATPase [Trebonia sp.]|jgi:DNA-binding CsgD family transcriptional regulator/tetratricopeptide (TPR) repeat protein|nr:AAA family ATPase [Trebonia sp.]